MFITFEGIDGSGKSTQAGMLADRLERTGREVHLFREPGGTALAERVRTILLDPTLDVEPLAELLLFSSARAQLVEEGIRPALERGATVVCDRFYDSTTAYQGGGRAVAGLEWLHAFNRTVTGGLIPDRTYLVSISPELAVERRSGRGDAREADTQERLDRMERSDTAFYGRVAAAYEDLAMAEPHRIVRLDGRLGIDELHDIVWSDVQELRVRRRG